MLMMRYFNAAWCDIKDDDDVKKISLQQIPTIIHPNPTKGFIDRNLHRTSEIIFESSE